MKEQLKDTRNSRATNAVIKTILSKGMVPLPDFYEVAYEEYKIVPGKHNRPAKIREKVRDVLNWLRKKGLL